VEEVDDELEPAESDDEEVEGVEEDDVDDVVSDFALPARLSVR